MTLRENIEKIDEMPLADAYLNLRYAGVTVEGMGNLLATGAGLVVSNHEHIDDSFLYYRLLRQQIERTPIFAVTSDVFDWPGLHGAIMREFLESKRQIPVDRFDPRSAILLREAMNAELEAGELGVIFPESTTPKTGLLHRFHTVAAQIALDSQVPITMMHIKYAKKPRSLRRDVRIRIAPAMQPEEFAGMNRSELSTTLQHGVGGLGGQALSATWASDPGGYTSEWHSDRFVPKG